MPNRWDIPLGGVPGDTERLLDEAAHLLAHDLRTTFPDTVSVTLSRSNQGDPFLVLVGEGSLTPIWVDVDEKQSKTTVAVAKVILDSALFDGHLTPWPLCPLHPDGHHSLKPVARGDQAAWICPESDRTVALIGGLATGATTES